MKKYTLHQIDNREIYFSEPDPNPINYNSEITAVRALQIKTAYIAIAIGITLSFLSISGTSSGGAFNPTRAIGAAIIAWKWLGQWVFWVGDLLGAGLAAGF